MKETFLLTALRNAAKRIPMGLGIALALTLPRLNATAQEVNLGTANNFAVLAGSTITAANPSSISGGDVGLSPGTSITGTISITPPYTTQVNGVAGQAQTDLGLAYIQAAALTANPTLLGQELGGLTLLPGVYAFSSVSVLLDGTLTLNDNGEKDPLFVFQIGSTLTTGSGSKVQSINVNDAQGTDPAASVFWQVGSAATLGTTSVFEGNIMAYSAITDAGGSTVDGRLLVETDGAVSLNNTTITAPPAEGPDTGSALLLLGSGLAALLAFGRRFPSLA